MGNENMVLTETHPGAFDNISAAANDSNKDEDPQVDFAPGEGQKPTNILKDEKWDINTMPHLFPTGEWGLHHPRARKLTDQQYFGQRLLNYDQRFARTPSFLFAATQHVELRQLQRNINLSFTRGKRNQGDDGTCVYSIEDGFSVFDNISNTMRFWSKWRGESNAKLENEGAFQFFNTQSCADQRWDENFTSLLRDNPDIKIIFETNQEENDVDFAKIKVKNTDETGKIKWTYKDDHGNEKETKVVTLQEYLKKYMLESTHETIRKSVLNATRNFNHRVKAFYRHIVKGSSNRMSIGFYNYRIEFQDRGAGHVHGVLWVDFDAFENNESNIEDFADKNEEEIGAGVKKLRSAFKKFKDDEVLSVEEYEKVTKFVDTFISCSTDPEIVQTKLYRVKLKKKHIPRRENISKEIKRNRKTFDEAENSDNESLDSSDSENSDSNKK